MKHLTHCIDIIRSSVRLLQPVAVLSTEMFRELQPVVGCSGCAPPGLVWEGWATEDRI